MANYYVRKQDVLNRGFAGYTTDDTLQILNSILIKDSQELSLITIFLGANDAVIDPPNSNSHFVELDEYIDNIRYMIHKIKDSNSQTRIILIAPPPVDERKEHYRKNSSTINYRNACLDLSKDLNVPIVDTWDLFKGKDENLLYTDGLHLNKLGNDLVFEGLKSVIKQNWPDFQPKMLKNLYR
ncbi:hypothetical protein HK099_001043 [Clydaea vesicula]|uniref:SGNH hydrolase-type esterase domain-containing protein n=1 Tax=Clydaea vesicula TaxID=447962 RepID=A0AAD5TU22_9FUNG|nr:hypothetical protein HK099_001043 [Clydaea vesicula]KAJ3377350.1 hypothetical protein HDU92_008423 [Lobulomyces angularis]